jgi:hypothetical protein
MVVLDRCDVGIGRAILPRSASLTCSNREYKPVDQIDPLPSSSLSNSPSCLASNFSAVHEHDPSPGFGQPDRMRRSSHCCPGDASVLAYCSFPGCRGALGVARGSDAQATSLLDYCGNPCWRLDIGRAPGGPCLGCFVTSHSRFSSSSSRGHLSFARWVGIPARPPASATGTLRLVGRFSDRWPGADRPAQLRPPIGRGSWSARAELRGGLQRLARRKTGFSGSMPGDTWWNQPDRGGSNMAKV